jgi:hypothetical protein
MAAQQHIAGFFWQGLDRIAGAALMPPALPDVALPDVIRGERR